MRRSGSTWIALGLVLVLGALAGMSGQRTSPGTGSTLSRAGTGLLGFRSYLEAQGAHVVVLDRPMADWPQEGVVLTAFPWSTAPLGEAVADLALRVGGGLDLVVGTSGSGMDPDEDRLLDRFGVDRIRLRGEPPLLPWRFWAWASEEWDLRRPGQDDRIRVRAVEYGSVPPAGAQILLENGEGRPLGFAFRYVRGRVVVLPTEAIMNGRLIGSAGVAETLRALSMEWAVDEFHHGLAAADTAPVKDGRHAFDAYLAHVLFLYGLTVFALARRLGPAWSEPVLATGSAAAFLVGLGALHVRLGHAGEAARRLTARAQEWMPHLEVPTGEVRTSRDLLAHARRVALAQAQGRRTL